MEQIREEGTALDRSNQTMLAQGTAPRLAWMVRQFLKVRGLFVDVVIVSKS